MSQENRTMPDKIEFADHLDVYGFKQAHILEKFIYKGMPFVSIADGMDYPDYESVTVSSKKHAKALIEALNKAIDLGWLE